MSECHIAGLAIRVRPEDLSATIAVAAAQEGAEVVASDPVGKVVVVVEAPTTGRIADVVDVLRHEDGVYAVDMVYHEVASDDGGAPTTDAA